MHFICRPFIGATSDNNWSRYWENEPDDPLIASSKGHLFALLSLNNKSTSASLDNIASTGQQLIEKLNQAYFSDSETNIETSLKKSINNTCKPFSENFDISLITAIVHQDTFYACIYNSGNISIIRQNQISQILTSKELDITFISGPFQDKDKFILYNQSFVDLITWPKIKEILSLDKLELIEENFLPSIYSGENKSSPAATLIEIHNQKQQILANSIEKTTTEKTTTETPARNLDPSVQLETTIKPKLSIFKKFFKPKNITISPHELTQVSKRRRLNLIIVFLSLLGLATSTYIGYQKNSRNKAENSFQSLKENLNQKIADTIAIKTLNLDTASELSIQAQLVLDEMKKLEIHQDETEEYQKKVTSLLSQTGSSDAFQPDSFFDTSLIVSQPSFSKLLSHQDTLYLLDQQKGRIDSLDIFKKAILNISINDKAKQTENFFLINNNVFAQTPDTVYQVSKDNWQSKIDLNKSNPDLNIIDARSWNSAIYLLDSTTPSVWKFNPSADSFGPIQNWLKEKETLPDEPTSIAINGKIWILSQDGNITPYLRGEQDNYKQNKEGEINNANNLVVTLDDDILAFTANDNIIYVYNKEGQSIAKYNLGDKKIHDICIHESSNTIFILCHDQKIYKITL